MSGVALLWTDVHIGIRLIGIRLGMKHKDDAGVGEREIRFHADVAALSFCGSGLKTARKFAVAGSVKAGRISYSALVSSCDALQLQLR